MFTFRAERHGNTDADDGYDTYQAPAYTVNRGQARTEVVLRDAIGEVERALYVGRQPHGIFAVVYVMNAAGKTVDTIR